MGKRLRVKELHLLLLLGRLEKVVHITMSLTLLRGLLSAQDGVALCCIVMSEICRRDCTYVAQRAR